MTEPTGVGGPEITEDQHFVPRFYLRRFAGSSNELQILDGRYRRIMKPRGPKGICKERFFYAVQTGKPDEVSQGIEAEFQRVESQIAANTAPVVEALLNEKQVEDREKWDIAYLMAMIWSRGPSMRAQINAMTQQVAKKMMEMAAAVGSLDDTFDRMDTERGQTTPPEIREDVKKTFASGNYEIAFSNQQHLMFLSDIRGFANLFHGQYWRVYVNRTDESFVTSDNPVAVVEPPRKGFFGATFLERTHYFSLSPELCIVATYPDTESGKKLRRTTLFRGSEDEVVQLNLKIASRAYRYVYARERRPLDRVLEVARAVDALKAARPKTSVQAAGRAVGAQPVDKGNGTK